ncbi:MAG: HAD-IA family hydrolase [Asgard group archaeon]|nr:HAD-IA family hydrolase [Asgard group archaeon]
MDKIALSDYKGIIFDLDGVIYDITEAIKKAVDDGIEKYQLENINRDNVMEEIAHLIEEIQNYPVPKILLNSFELLQVKFLEGLSFFKKLRIAIFLFNQFNKYKEDESTIFKGIDDLISKLAKNVKLAILTNNKSQYAEEVLEKFNLTKYFGTIIGFNEVSDVKPSPEGILKILDTWKIKPSETIFIGDMSTDIEAGKSANVKMVCVASGLAKRETLLEHNPDILVDNTDQLIKLFNF